MYKRGKYMNSKYDKSIDKAYKILTLVMLILFLLTLAVSSKADDSLELTIQQLSYKYGVNPKLVKAIIAVESSNCKYNYNKRSKDYGCMQINIKNIHALKLDKQRLLVDHAYGIEHGIKILAQFKRYRHKEPLTWYCRYNVGTGKLVTRRGSLCLQYANKVQNQLNNINKATNVAITEGQ